MFVRFKVKNFLSFNEMTEISMIKGKIKNKSERVFDAGELKLLKFAAIFGANAAGKSNIVKAIDFAKDCIVNEFPNHKRDLYFKGESESNSKSLSYFEFELLINGKLYSYGFEVDLTNKKFASEWLIHLKPKSEEIIFTRDIKKKSYKINITDLNKDVKNKMEVYFDDLKDNEDALFLKEMNRLKDKLYRDKSNVNIIKDIYMWFSSKLIVSGSNNLNSRYTYLLNEKNSGKILETLKLFKTGITKYEFKKVSLDDVLSEFPKSLANKLSRDIEKTQKHIHKIKLTKDMFEEFNGAFPFAGFRTQTSFNILLINSDGEIFVSEIKLNHSNSKYEFDFREESEGTRILFDLMEILFDNEDKFYIIDELDRSLHPQLTHKFVQIFLNLAKKRNAQLMVTTHESRLLDFDLLRQDEIWLVEKNDKGESSIYSLDEYNVRYDKKIDKAYLEGRYGGVPVFNSIFPIEEI